jgi:hypothetical protein
MLTEKEIAGRFRKEPLLACAAEELPHWSDFNLVTAHKVRLERHSGASFNDLLWECGHDVSGRLELPGHALMWHVSKIRHRDNILRHGFFHHKGVYFAPASHGLPFHLAAALSPEERDDYTQLVLFGCLVDTRTCRPGIHFETDPAQWRFMARVSPDVIEWVIEDGRIVLVGAPLARRDRVPRVTFRRDRMQWRTPGRNPICFPGRGEFAAPEELLDLYLPFLFERHGTLTLFELLNGAYSVIQPGEALPLEAFVSRVARSCRDAGRYRNQMLLRWDRDSLPAAHASQSA